MDNNTIPVEFAVILGIILYGTILFFLIRYILMCSSIKRKSQLYEKLKVLNNQYMASFHTLKKKIEINHPCNSLQQYRNNCNNLAVTNYMCGRIMENETMWQDLYDKANSNKNTYETYLQEYEGLKQTYGGLSYEDVKKRTFFFSEKQYVKFEEKYCNSKLLHPQTSLYIVVNNSYTSPAGRNHYAKSYELKDNRVDELFTRIEDRKISERSIDYQRALMTTGKRYDILKRDNFTCQICGRRQSDGARLEVDHIIPVSKGGKTVDENLRTLCHECNQGKKDKM